MMKLKTIALASALTMCSTFALAQADGGVAGASSGPAVNGGSTTAAPSTTTGGERMQRTPPVKPLVPPQSPAEWMSRSRAANRLRVSLRAKSNPSSDFDPVSLKKTPWTDEENERLRRLARSGVSIFRAAAALKRKTGSTRTQARKIGCPFPTIKEMRLKNSHSPDGQRL
jgi:hypothetical protein